MVGRSGRGGGSLTGIELSSAGSGVSTLVASIMDKEPANVIERAVAAAITLWKCFPLLFDSFALLPTILVVCEERERPA